MISRAARRAYETAIAEGATDAQACAAAVACEQRRFVERTEFWNARLRAGNSARTVEVAAPFHIEGGWPVPFESTLTMSELDAAEMGDEYGPGDADLGPELTVALSAGVLAVLYHAAQSYRGYSLTQRRRAEDAGEPGWFAHRENARRLADAAEAIERALAAVRVRGDLPIKLGDEI